MSNQFTERDREIVSTRLYLDNPFWGTLGMSMKWVPDSSIRTLRTDGTTTWYNPEYMSTLTFKQQLTAFAHEINHPALGHIWRRGSRDPKKWNEAADYAENPVLLDSGFEAIPGWLFEERFRGMSAEQIYSLRESEEQVEHEKQQQQNQEDCSDQGESTEDSDSEEEANDEDLDDDEEPGEGADSTDGSADDGGDVDGTDGFGESSEESSEEATDSQGGTKPSPTPQESPVEPGNGQEIDSSSCPTGDFIDPSDEDSLSEAEWQVAVVQAAKVAMHAGTLPGHMKQMLEAAQKERRDWKEDLKQWMTKLNDPEQSWSTRNKRYVHRGLHLPGRIVNPTMGTLVIMDDTSGSFFNSSTQNRVAAAINEIVQDCKPEKTYVLYVDTAVREVVEFGPDDEIKLEAKGGGGTRLQPGFDWVEHEMVEPDAVIYLTDAYSSDVPVDPGYPVLWVLPEWTSSVPDFGDVVRYTFDE